jgi:hypothetical protein
MGIVTKTQVKKFFRQNEMRVGIEFYDSLDHAVEELLQGSIERAKRNRRGTVLPQDL